MLIKHTVSFIVLCFVLGSEEGDVRIQKVFVKNLQGEPTIFKRGTTLLKENFLISKYTPSANP